MNGLLLVDKPEGMSSYNVVKSVKKILKVKKIGHTGTLDPLATGLLLHKNQLLFQSEEF